MEVINRGAGAAVQPNIESAGRVALSDGAALRTAHAHHYEIECRGPDGQIRWHDSIDNLVPNVGLNELLDKFWKGSTYTAAFFVGLISASPTVAAADTMSSHAGWTEVTAFTQGARQSLVLGTVASQSVNSGASPAVFSIDTNATAIGGAFITTSSTKGGSTGILIGAGALTGGNKTLGNGDTLSITVTATAAAA